MASNDHKAVQIKKGDVVVLSSSPIPGNEKTISNVVNKLFEKGAEVIVEGRMEGKVFMAKTLMTKCPSKYEKSNREKA
jgi:mRNA degradation ribonuclease J1/J2